MPIQASSDNISTTYHSGDLGYKYPEGLDLRPGSQQHQDLLGKIMERARASKNVMSSRYPEWKKVDETLDGYIAADAAEAKVQADDSRKPISIS